MTNLKKNMEMTVDIISEGYEGEGVAKPEGFPIFVPGALKGEKVRIVIIKLAKSHGFGKLIEILKASPHRREPSCPIYKRCGGCQLQHVSYEEQLKFKKNRVTDCIERIGKIDHAVIHDTLGMENPSRYRNKVQLPVGTAAGNPIIGFYAARSHDIIDLQQCGIQHEVGDKVVEITRRWMSKYGISGNDEEKGTGTVRHIMVRKGFKSGEVMVVLVTNSPELPYRDEFITAITDNVPDIKSIVQNINSKKTNVVLGLDNVTLWGSDTITDYIGEFRFYISPLSFFQVNPVQ
ncbi:MAG: 23S rRNA (uracil(1939)-C(5))-methyltransferase RlmD, partial [Bacillota bacterium]|nr:23S rRNA (uracil(1939)-C(5))-methyltransferase RlmD [Bacillota bacterium]